MSLSVMSADSHMDLIYLPPDTFTSRIPSTWRDRAPRVVERDGRKVWVSGDAVLGPWGVYGPGVTGERLVHHLPLERDGGVATRHRLLVGGDQPPGPVDLLGRGR